MKLVLKRILLLAMALCLLAASAAAEEADTLTARYAYRGGEFLFEKVSHPETAVENADGIVDYIGANSVAPYVPGVSEQGRGDRGQSYSYCSASYGDWVYIGTMYGGLGASSILGIGMGGLDSEMSTALMQVMYNGNMYQGEPDGGHAGGVLLKFNVKTGETKVLLSRDVGGIIPTFRNAIEMNGKLYFVGMVLDLNNPDLTQAEITTAIMMQNGFPCIYEVDPANNDKITCIYDCVDIKGFRKLVADNVFTSTRAIGSYQDMMIAGCLDETRGAFLAISANPSAGQDSFHVIAEMDDLFGYPAIKRSDANGGGGIYQVIEYNNALYVVICAGDAASRNPETGTLRGFAIVKGVCNGEPTRKSSWKWSVLAGDPEDGAKYPFALDEERVSAVACSLEVYGDYLYIGEYNDVSSALQGFVLRKDFTTQATNLDQSINLYRMDKSERIEKVVGDPTKAFPVSLTGLGSGFGNHMNQYTWQTTVYNGKMYLSTMDTTTFLRPIVMFANGDLFRMEADEWRSQLNYIRVLVELMMGKDEADAASLNADDQVQQATQRARGRRRSQSAFSLTGEQQQALSREARRNEKLDIAVGKKLLDINDRLEALIDSFATTEADAFAAEYNALMADYGAISDQLPANIKAMYDLLLNYATQENIAGIARSMQYMTNAVAGFDLFEIAHTENGGVTVNTITGNGFGDRYNHGLRIFEETDNYWLVGTANPFYGTQLWRAAKVVEAPEVPAAPAAPVPNTGDDSHVMIWAALMIISCACMGMLGKKKKTV